MQPLAQAQTHGLRNTRRRCWCSQGVWWAQEAVWHEAQGGHVRPRTRAHPPVWLALMMLAPGAMMNRQLPMLEKEASASERVVAPTVMEPKAEAGE